MGTSESEDMFACLPQNYRLGEDLASEKDQKPSPERINGSGKAQHSDSLHARYSALCHRYSAA